MSVYPTRQGWSVDYRDEFGHRKRVHVGSQAAAHAFEARIRSHVAAVRRAAQFSTTLPDLTITEALDLFLAALVCDPRTRHDYSRALSHFARELRGTTTRNVTPQLLASYSHSRAQHIAPGTLKRELACIKRLFQFLTANWYIHADPSTQLSPGRIRVESPARFVTLEEQHRLLTSTNQKGRLRILLALDAGLRAGEVHAARANHIQSSTRTLTVWSSKNRITRKIPLTERLWSRLEARTPPAVHPDTPLITYGGLPQRRSAQWWRTLSARAKVHARFHDLRHTFASRLAALGAPLHVIRALLGHRPPTTTDLYCHATEEETRHWIDRMEDADLNQGEQKN